MQIECILHLPMGARIGPESRLWIFVEEGGFAGDRAPVQLCRREFERVAELAARGSPLRVALSCPDPDPSLCYELRAHLSATGSSAIRIGDCITTRAHPLAGEAGSARIESRLELVGG